MKTIKIETAFIVDTKRRKTFDFQFIKRPYRNINRKRFNGLERNYSNIALFDTN